MNRKIKWIAVIVSIIVYIIFGGMLPGVPLTSRAMALGLGIDLKDGNVLSVSLQLPVTTSSQSGTNSSARVITAEAQTVSDAISKISEETGLNVTLTHCKVVFIGQKLFESPLLYGALSYALNNDNLSENAAIFACEGDASSLMGLSMAFGDNASVYSQTLVGDFAGYNSFPSKTLREYFVDHFRLGKTNWLPFLVPVPTDALDSSSSTASSGDSSGGGGGGSGQEKSDYMFKLQNVAVFADEQFSGFLSGDTISAFSYIDRKVKKGSFESTGKNGESICLYISGVKKKIKTDAASKTAEITIEIDAILKEIKDNTGGKHVDRTELSAEEIKIAENSIKKDIETLFADMAAKNIDVFYLKEAFYSANGKKAKDLPLQDMKITAKVKINVD